MRNAIHSIYKKTAEAVLPPLATSQFEEKKVLTPQEFVVAGDYLVRACPTWKWEAGDASKARNYFPQDKQYLVTRGVPCLSRASDIEKYDPRSEFALGGDDEGWVATHQDPASAAATAASAAADDIPDLDDTPSAAAGSSGQAAGASSSPAAAADEDDLPDIEDLELVEPEDEAALPAPSAGGGEGIKRTRTYDLYITYDQYYQVPRFWLVGFDEAKQPLTPQQVLQDVSEEHARKTITLDPHPHLAVNAASIHPCRHAEVMKKLADNMAAGGSTLPLEQYMVLFLKFIASVVPTIQYDYTMPVGGAA